MTRNDTKRELASHYVEFYNMARAMLQDDDDARDAVQEALTRTLARWRTGNALRYCRAVLHNECINILRERKQLVLADDLDQLHDFETTDLQHLTAEAVSKLPREVRSLIELHDIDGYTYSDLATITGTSITTIHRIISQAHEHIKQQVKSQF